METIKTKDQKEIRIEGSKTSADRTVETYKKGFETYRNRTPDTVMGEFKEWIDGFSVLLPEGANILELGSATGRDARYFSNKGFRVTCTDIMPEALDELSRDGFTTSEYDFRDEPKEEWIHRFDGYFANAVLLHASPDVFIQALATIPKILKRGGFAAFSVKAGDGEEESMEKMDAPRYFNYHTEPELRELLSNLPVEIVSITHPDNGKWLHLVIKSVE